MKYGIKILAALTITVSVILGTNLCSAQEIAPTVTECGCDNANCGLKKIGLRNSSRGACSDCDCEVCLLETKAIKEKKTCFKVEEKVICVPAVRMPWHKCNPPTTSKTKTFKVLKKESYKSPACSYKWSIAKAGESEPTATKTATDNQTTVASTASKPMPPIVRASNLKLRLRKGTDFTAPAK